MSLYRRFEVFIATGLVLVFLSAAPPARGAETKVRVIVENATVRLSPSLESEAVEENIAIDTVFTVEKKTGEWYEVKVQTKLGVTVVGYIHEMYVEVVTETEAPPVPEPKPEPVVPDREMIPAAGDVPRGIRFGLRLGGGLAALRPGYDWQYSFVFYGEDFVIRDSVANAAGFGFDAELGVFVMPFLEVTAGFGLASKSLTGTYGLDVPNQILWDDIATDTTELPVKYSANFFSFGLNFYPMPGGRLSPFIGLGGCRVSAKMDLMEDITYRDTYYSNLTHAIDIEEVQISQEKLSKFGFFFRAGLQVLFTPNIYGFLQGKYVLAKTSVDHLLSAFIDDLEPLDIDLGGLFAGLGIGIVF